MRFVQKVVCAVVASGVVLAVISYIIKPDKVNTLCEISCQGLHQIPLTTQYERKRSTSDVLRAIIQDGYNLTLSSKTLVSHGRFYRKMNYKKRMSSVAKAQENFTEDNWSSTDPIVPNVVHYVLMGPNLTFTFVTYLSFLSVERFLKPEQIFVHGDSTPTGHWWNLALRQVKNIYHVKRPYLKIAVNGQPFRYVAHASDYVRADVLLRYGGIYLDPDVIVLKSFDPLRNYSMVLGRETKVGICNGIMIAQKGALFLRLILEQYLSYRGLEEGWAEKSVFNVHTLARLYPHLVHVEETSLNRPNWGEKALIYDGCYDWRENYAMHLWLRTWPEKERPTREADVINKTTTFGSICRLILSGKNECLSRSSIILSDIVTMVTSVLTIRLAVRLLER